MENEFDQKKKENNEEIKTIKEQEEALENDQLESLEGGINENSVACTCDCLVGNSNNNPPNKLQ